MKELTIQREPSTNTEVMGLLTLGVSGIELLTIEQEWRPTSPGGEPNNSCVPAGRYKLLQHTRPNGDIVVALENPGLGVYYAKHTRPNGVGRYLILIHAGNTTEDIVGCIAPGLSAGKARVNSSRNAMKLLMEYIGGEIAELVIRDA